jgi:hypothetical protein
MDSAKEYASRVVGRWGLAAIVFVVGMVIFSAFALSAEALTPIVGLAYFDAGRYYRDKR